ncbi:GTP cyclohydrolase II [Ancylobacter vacuolatus]|uniref:GTP cyclohydrolase II n=1 Tax=Ancylobacter vacuolatus TaxID=223389 RepID=A0ABU0DLY2_9HYPH|nr:GTP cyclohydrolase II [Ancylobacter vacuolatus]MDQ0349437.1 GTP cyclohydrolase II [Ancylobacter vacuolatus]
MSVNASAGGRSRNHIVLTSHGAPTGVAADGPVLNWGAPDPALRGPVVATLTEMKRRNAIGTHAGGYAVYRALAIAAGALPADFKADLTNTAPSDIIGPHPQWGDPGKIVSLDPFGHMIGEAFGAEVAAGLDVRPSIAITRAHIDMPEIRDALRAGRLKIDGDIIGPKGDVRVTKAAIEPVWYLPGIAARFGVSEGALRRALFEHTGGMFPELVTRGDLKVFLPPIGGMTLYLFGDPSRIGDGVTPLACRVHDECNGSDVFSSDICTCRPYLAHGIEICVEMAQQGGVGLVVYNRKEGRALGEVTKFLVYNARKRQEGGDLPETYFKRTECVAGVQDMRFQELMPDVFHWLGITRIDRFASMSDMKFNALERAGIEVGERVAIPEELIPLDARVEMEAKVSAGYFSGGFQSQFDATQGRALEE